MGVPGAQIADIEARDDPADRAPHPDAGEVSGGLIHLPEGDGVDQRQGRHVENHVREHARIEGVETPSAGERSEERRVGKECRSRWWSVLARKMAQSNAV